MEAGSRLNIWNGHSCNKDSLKAHHKKFQLDCLRNFWGKVGVSKSILCYPQRWGGQVLHCQLVSTTVKTHHKKFQLNRSRNGWVTKNSKNLWNDREAMFDEREAMFDEREAMAWWWIPSKNLVTSHRLVRVSRSGAATIIYKAYYNWKAIQEQFFFLF